MLGHYRVIEQIGAGGMGIVYRAHDEQLDRDVAIKVLPAGMLADDVARKRFRKEALALARLNHPNVATVHEFGNQAGTDFLVTEYIVGVSLDQQVAAGPLPIGQFLDLARQLVQGLGAAHEDGIVHCDLKPANLRLTPDGRLKILDFGLAHWVPRGGELGPTVTLTAHREVSGTLPYMAPEQLRGGTANTRTDIWATGVVLYEMATAHRPFEGQVPTALVDDIIHKAPLPPRKLRSELSPNLDAVILKCLEKQPARRYQSVRELQSDLERLGAGRTLVRAGRRWLWLAIAGTLALSLGVAGSRYLVLHRREPEPASSRERRSVAVLGFKNVSSKPEEDWVSTALSEMLTTELAAGQSLRTIPGENVARTKIDLSLPDTNSYSPDTLSRIRKNLGADYVVLGSYYDTGKEAGGRLRLDLWLQDARAGETVAAVSETGTEAQLIDLVSRTGSELRGKLGVGEVMAADANAIRASMPADPEAARLYSDGLSRLRKFDALGAQGLLERAAAREPNFALVHSALAEAWSRLGYDVKAKGEAKTAFDLSATLSPEDRLLVEARYREANRQGDKAIELYRALFDQFPDNLEYGLFLAATQMHLDRAKDALGTVEALRRTSSLAREDPRVDLAEAYGAESLGDFKRAQTAASNAVRRSEAIGAPLLSAAAKLQQCRTLRNRGQYRDAVAACRSARDAYANSGNSGQMAVAMVAVGATAYEQGDLAGAEKSEEDALAVFQQIGHKSGIASTLSEIANVLSARGDHAGAELRYRQALATYRELESIGNVGAEMHNVAGQLSAQGDLDRAIREFRQALTINRQVGQEDVVAMDLANLGSALLLRGNLNESAQMMDQSLEICRRIDFKEACGVTLSSQGDLLRWTGRPDLSKEKYLEALAIRNEMGAQIDAAETQLSMAELGIEAGSSGDAEERIREARETIRKQQLVDDEVWADAVLARTLLAKDKIANASQEIDQGTARGAKIQNEEVRLKLALAAASVLARSSTPVQQATAGNDLETTLKDAKRHGFVGYQLEARLVLGQMELNSNRLEAGRTRLLALEKDARQLGFLGIANRAALVAKKPGHDAPLT